MHNRIATVISTFFFIGFFPGAPGSAASFAGLLIYIILFDQPAAYFGLLIVFTVVVGVSTFVAKVRDLLPDSASSMAVTCSGEYKILNEDDAAEVSKCTSVTGALTIGGQGLTEVHLPELGQATNGGCTPIANGVNARNEGRSHRSHPWEENSEFACALGHLPSPQHQFRPGCLPSCAHVCKW